MLIPLAQKQGSNEANHHSSLALFFSIFLGMISKAMSSITCTKYCRPMLVFRICFTTLDLVLCHLLFCSSACVYALCALYRYACKVWRMVAVMPQPVCTSNPPQLSNDVRQLLCPNSCAGLACFRANLQAPPCYCQWLGTRPQAKPWHRLSLPKAMIAS